MSKSDLSAINATTNPFIGSQIALRASLTVVNVSGYDNQRVCLSALLGGCLLCVLLAMGFRWKKGSLWLYRITTTSEGRFITPNPVACLLFLSSMFLIVVQPYLWKPSTFLSSSVWIFLWLGRWNMSLGTLVATITSVTRIPHTRRIDLAKYPFLCNLFFVVIPLILASCIFTLAGISQYHFNQVKVLYSTLDVDLTAAAIAFDAGIAVDAQGLTLASDALKAEYALGLLYTNRGWYFWSVFTFLELVVFVFTSTAHVRSLIDSLSNIKKQQTSGSVNRKVDSLNGAVRSLIWTSIVTSIVGLSHLAASLYLSIMVGRQSIGSTEIVGLLVLWIYVTAGGASYVLILVRTFSSTLTNNNSHSNVSRFPNSVFSPNHLATALRDITTVQITKEVHEMVEEGEGEKGDRIYDVELELGVGNRGAKTASESRRDYHWE